METMSSLRKYAKESGEGMPRFRLGVIGDCATQHISTAIRGTGIKNGTDLQVFDADYNQILAQTADPHSELYEFNPDAVLVFNCTEKLYEEFQDTPVSEREGFAEKKLTQIESVWKSVSAHCGAKILQTTFTEYDDRTCGNFGARLRSSFIFQMRKLNYLMCDRMNGDNVYPIDMQFISEQYGAPEFRSTKNYAMAKIPFSTNLIPAIAEEVWAVISAMTGKVNKCLILDLDNTMWGGVVGDVGFDGIEIGDLGVGHAFTAFQKWVLELKKRGIILTVCSKNFDDKAKEPFEKNPEMTAKLEDFALFVANWEHKGQNIANMQKRLNIGFDSMIFIDDSAFERGSVRDMLPDVKVPEMPPEPSDYVDFLRGQHLFETVAWSEEDAKRNDMYRAEADRAILSESFADYGDYLRGLEMRAVAKPFDSFWYPRIAQLSQRSNQFNLRTVRYTEEEIQRIAESDDYLTVYFTLRDRFGDYGLISAVIMKKDDENLFVDTWIMSCRVLKRTMEEFIVNKMISVANENGFRTVTGQYLPTKKNGMVRDIYSKLGFEDRGDGIFTAGVDGFRYNESFISEE
ncbi:MAG: HAD family hydrolase [Clostridia bacterium]|nr:HAD family hydrolase [Clostridia bacterium]